MVRLMSYLTRKIDIAFLSIPHSYECLFQINPLTHGTYPIVRLLSIRMKNLFMVPMTSEI